MEKEKYDLNIFEQLVDIRDIHMDEDMTRAMRIEHLKKVSKDGLVKYKNVIVKLEFCSVYDEDIEEHL